MSRFPPIRFRRSPVAALFGATAGRTVPRVALLAGVLVMVGCSSSNNSNSKPATVAPTVTTVATVRSTAASPTPATVRTAVATTTPATGAVPAGTPTLQLRGAASPTTALTAPNGRTLYVFDRDTPGVSNCTAACASTWTALTLAAGNPVAPAGLAAGSLTVFTRSDGPRQVAYNGRPLYTYSGDQAAGDTKGDGTGGIWHVATVATTGASPTPTR